MRNFAKNVAARELRLLGRRKRIRGANSILLSNVLVWHRKLDIKPILIRHLLIYLRIATCDTYNFLYDLSRRRVVFLQEKSCIFRPAVVA